MNVLHTNIIDSSLEFRELDLQFHVINPMRDLPYDRILHQWHWNNKSESIILKINEVDEVFQASLNTDE